MIVIRPRRSAHLEELGAVLRRVHAVSGYPIEGVDNPEKKLCSGDLKQVWVAERDGGIIGHVAVEAATADGDLAVRLWRKTHADEPLATLGKLFVHPDRWGGGTATKLIETAMGWSREAGLQLILFVLVKDERATRLYSHLGWTQFGRDVYNYGDGEQMEAICFASPEAKR